MKKYNYNKSLKCMFREITNPRAMVIEKLLKENEELKEENKKLKFKLEEAEELLSEEEVYENRVLFGHDE